MSSAQNASLHNRKFQKQENEIVFLNHINGHRNQITFTVVTLFAGKETNENVDLIATHLQRMAHTRNETFNYDCIDVLPLTTTLLHTWLRYVSIS
jgi:hypothetical protein